MLWEESKGLMTPESRKTFFGKNGAFNHLGLDVVGSFAEFVKEAGYAPPRMSGTSAKYWRDKEAIGPSGEVKDKFTDGQDFRYYVFFTQGIKSTPQERMMDAIGFGLNPAESRHFNSYKDRFPGIPKFTILSMTVREAAQLHVPWPGQQVREFWRVPVGYLLSDPDGNLLINGVKYRSNIRQDLQANFPPDGSLDKLVFRPLGWVPASVGASEGGWNEFKNLSMEDQLVTLRAVIHSTETTEARMQQIRWFFGR